MQAEVFLKIVRFVSFSLCVSRKSFSLASPVTSTGDLDCSKVFDCDDRSQYFSAVLDKLFGLFYVVLWAC